MRLILFSSAAALALSACAEPASETAPSAPSGSKTPATPTDACGAAEREDWVGRARAGLPAAPAGASWRVFETGQPVSHDLRPERLNVEIDPDSQTVVRLTCG